MHRNLRDVGGDLVLSIPREFVERNGLTDGSRVELHLVGKRMSVAVPRRPRYRAEDLMAEMPEGLRRVERWEEMPSVGAEDDTGGTRPTRTGLMRFAASQKNIDCLAMRLFVCVAAFGVLVAIRTIAAMIAK